MIGLPTEEHVATRLMDENSVSRGPAGHTSYKFNTRCARKENVVNTQLPAPEPDGLSPQARIND